MDFNEYQEKAWTTAKEPHTDFSRSFVDRLEYEALCIAGEAGELCNKIKKIRRDNKGVVSQERLNEIVGEMGGILWYLSSLCMQINIPLSYVAIDNLEELFKRKENGTISGEGDKR